MKKKLVAATLVVLMLSFAGCGANATSNTENMETSSKQEEAQEDKGADIQEANENSTEINVTDENAEIDSTEESVENETAENNDLSAVDLSQKAGKEDFPRLVQYLECNNYDQLKEMVRADLDEASPSWEYIDMNIQDMIDGESAYAKYDAVNIDGALYESISICYMVATKEIINMSLLSGPETKEKCLAIEQFALDRFGNDYEEVDLHVGGELGEAMEDAFLYKYRWDKDGAAVAMATGMHYDGEYRYSIGAGNFEYKAD